MSNVASSRKIGMALAAVLGASLLFGTRGGLMAASEQELKSFLVSNKWCMKEKASTTIHEFRSNGSYLQSIKGIDGAGRISNISENWYLKGEFVSIRVEGHLVEWHASIVQRSQLPKVLLLRPTRIITPDGKVETVKGALQNRELRLESCSG